jgi:hypothetical protein
VPKIKITRDHVKTAANFIVARSVSAVVVTIAHQNIKTESKLQNAELYVGAYVLGSMAADRAQEHIEKKIDAIADGIEKAKIQLAEAQAHQR